MEVEGVEEEDEEPYGAGPRPREGEVMAMESVPSDMPPLPLPLLPAPLSRVVAHAYPLPYMSMPPSRCAAVE